MKTIIVDDEQASRDVLKQFFSRYCPQVSVVGEAATVESGQQLIESLKFDVLFLDINLHEKTGFDLLDQLSSLDFKVIFLTAYDNFAIKAFQYNAIDYLLKPLIVSELQRVVQKLDSQLRDNTYVHQLTHLLQSQQQQQLTRISIPSMEGLLFLELPEIIRLESEGKYTTFFYGENQKAVVSKNIGHYEDLLPKEQFCRVDQSHIVNLRYVRKFLHEDGGYVLLENGEKIKVARRRKTILLNSLTQAS